MLFRALGHLDRGVYVDVGAQHPVMHSVTRAFYERGWRGMNIDPVPQWCELLRSDRPEDVNLQVAIGSVNGRTKFFRIDETGLSTTDEKIAAEHARKGYGNEEMTVDVRRLDDVLQEYRFGEVHFLKIDVEGAEVDVLRGMAFETVRPWIVVVEATRPLSQVPNYEVWEDLLLTRRYDFVYADGLNRFYLAHEHADLYASFEFPPNVFDDFVTASERDLRERVHVEHQNAVEHAQELIPLRLAHAELRAEMDRKSASLAGLESDVASLGARLGVSESALKDTIERCGVLQESLSQAEARDRLGQEKLKLALADSSRKREFLERTASHSRLLQQRIHHLDAESARLQATVLNLRHQLGDLQGSTSWLITAPLRTAGRLARRELTVRQAARATLAKLLLRFGPVLYRRRFVRNLAKVFLKLSPRAEAKVRRAIGAVPPTSAESTMTPRARSIFAALSRGR